jgi:hypothetical protein
MQSPSDADSSSDGQEINLILWNPKVYYHVRTTPPPDPFLRKKILIYIFRNDFFTINFNIILSYICLNLPNGIFPRDILTKILYTFLICAMRNRMSRPSQPSSCDQQDDVWRTVQIMKLFIM